MATSLSAVKLKVKDLYQTKTQLHVDLNSKSKHKHLTNISAAITGVYPNLFTVVLLENGTEKHYTFQYADLLTNDITIKEL